MPKFIRRLFSKKILTSYNALCNEPFQICGLSQESGFVFKNGQRASYPLAYVGGKPYKWIITNNLIVLECFDVCSVINPIPSIVILGTGSECLLLPQHLVTKFKKDNLSIECLKTVYFNYIYLFI